MSGPADTYLLQKFGIWIRSNHRESAISDYIKCLSASEEEAERQRYYEEPYSAVKPWKEFKSKCCHLQTHGTNPSPSFTQKGREFDTAYWNLYKRAAAALADPQHQYYWRWYGPPLSSGRAVVYGKPMYRRDTRVYVPRDPKHKDTRPDRTPLYDPRDARVYVPRDPKHKDTRSDVIPVRNQNDMKVYVPREVKQSDTRRSGKRRSRRTEEDDERAPLIGHR